MSSTSHFPASSSGFKTFTSNSSDMVIKVPDNVTDEEMAMVEPTAVGLHAIHLANIKVGDKIIIPQVKDE